MCESTGGERDVLPKFRVLSQKGAELVCGDNTPYTVTVVESYHEPANA